MRKVKVQPSGHEFGVEEGESVLSAALRQDLVLPYGCRNGACGSCKGRILEGRVDYGVYQKKALTDLPYQPTAGSAVFWPSYKWVTGIKINPLAQVGWYDVKMLQH